MSELPATPAATMSICHYSALMRMADECKIEIRRLENAILEFQCDEPAAKELRLIRELLKSQYTVGRFEEALRIQEEILVDVLNRKASSLAEHALIKIERMKLATLEHVLRQRTP